MAARKVDWPAHAELSTQKACMHNVSASPVTCITQSIVLVVRRLDNASIAGAACHGRGIILCACAEVVLDALNDLVDQMQCTLRALLPDLKPRVVSALSTLLEETLVDAAQQPSSRAATAFLALDCSVRFEHFVALISSIHVSLISMAVLAQ